MSGRAPLLRGGAGTLLAVPFLLGAAIPTTNGEPSPVREVTRFGDPRIIESSGLVDLGDGLLATVNDSGDAGRVYTVEARTGRTVGTTTWTASAGAEDVEALAPAGPGHVWVADIGDNLRRRGVVTVTRVPAGRGSRTVPGRTYELAWPGGARDAEALLAHPVTGRLLLADKQVLGGGVYVAPRRLRADRVNRLRRVGPGIALATDGAFLDAGSLVLRSYTRAVVLRWPGLAPVAEDDLPDQEQGEAAALGADGRLLVSSEGIDQPVLSVPVPREVE